LEEKDNEGEKEDEVVEEIPVEAEKPKSGGAPRGIRPPESREEQMKTFTINNSHTRRIFKCDIDDVPIKITSDEEDWVVFRFVGESFAYNQIRRMLGFALLVIYKQIDLRALIIALKSPFKFMVPMIPGECLYLEGGTFLDRLKIPTDYFGLLSQENAQSDDEIKERYHHSRAKVNPWAELLEQASTLTVKGAPLLQQMKKFRDVTLHPHISFLRKKNDTYLEFVEGLSHVRFQVNDLEVMEGMYAKWRTEEDEKKEKRKLKRKEMDEFMARERSEIKKMKRSQQSDNSRESTNNTSDNNNNNVNNNNNEVNKNSNDNLLDNNISNAAMES